MLDKTLRFVLTILVAIAGLMLVDRVIPVLAAVVDTEFLQAGIFGITMATVLSFIFGGLLFGAIGFFASPFLIRQISKLTSWGEAKLYRMPMHDILVGSLGLAIGLIIANLLGAAFIPIPLIGKYIPGVLSVIFGYLGINVAIRKRDEFLNIFSMLHWPGKERHRDKTGNDGGYKVLDTSVIIDGRIADICKSGFIEGTLLIPRFVLEELQHIADSSDLLKRNRGRRGLDILNRIQKEQGLHVHIDEHDFEGTEVDAKLVKLGQLMNAKVLTNDYNLNKVAELQGVTVLNINELSNAVKPVVLPGEEMLVQIVKDGKEFGQGVAYLDDGTMIVVDGGRKHMNETVSVLVTSVLQTAAGRMIFAKMKAQDKPIA